MNDFIAGVLSFLLAAAFVGGVWWIGVARYQRLWEEGRPKRVSACEHYGQTFEVQTKYDDTYGCLRKTTEGWIRV